MKFRNAIDSFYRQLYGYRKTPLHKLSCDFVSIVRYFCVLYKTYKPYNKCNQLHVSCIVVSAPVEYSELFKGIQYHLIGQSEETVDTFQLESNIKPNLKPS